jgi:hypothetical protein
MTRVGKIARLPRAIREPLNRRLQDGEPGKRLVVWLDSLPEVKAVLTAEFDGRAITEQNLSEWKAGGYRDWENNLERRALVRQLAEDAADLEAADKNGELSRHLSVVLAAELAQATREALAQTTDVKERLVCVGQAVGKFSQLRREESSAERARLIRERWQAEQNEAGAKNKTNHALFPIYAAVIHKSFMGLMASSSPESQAGTLQVLERLMEKRKKPQSAVSPPVGETGSTRFKPIQGKSSHLESVGQTKSNLIQPDPTTFSNGHPPSPAESAPPTPP